MKLSNNIPIISFFTGGGFLDMGFLLAGFEIVYSNEYIEDFALLHDAGITNWAKANGIEKEFKISSMDSIVDLKPVSILKKAFPNGVPQIWGIIGGPPCQDFTINGKMEGFSGDRGKMTIAFFRKIKQLRPPFFVMENVVGLMQNKESRKVIDQIINNHCADNYFIDRKILNALDFGVPQYRQRVFHIALRKDLFIPPNSNLFSDSENICTMSFQWPVEKYKNAYKSFDWPKRNPFGNQILTPKGIPLDLCINSCLKKASENSVPNIDEILKLTKNVDQKKDIQEGDTHRHSFKRLHRFRFSPTTCYGNNEVHLHPFENRRISVREALRIQGVDDSYSLPPKKLSAKFKLIGNGVPVPLAKAVALSLYAFISKYSKKA